MGRLKSKKMITHTFEVEIGEETSLDYYESLLTRYDQWKVFKREVRLTGLLNTGKKVQFDIEDVNLLVYTDLDAIQYIHKAVFRTDTITFILMDENIIILLYFQIYSDIQYSFYSVTQCIFNYLT